MMRFAVATRLFSILCITSAFLLSCGNPPRQDEVDRAFNKYVDTLPHLNDTLLYYTIKGDSLIMRFANYPEIRSWNFSFQFGNFKSYELNSRNEIVIVDEYVRTQIDSPDFVINAMPIAHQKIFINSKSNTFFNYGYMVRKPGVLYSKNPENVYVIDYSFYKKISDKKLKEALIDKINERYNLHNGKTVLPYLDSVSKEH